MKKIFFALIACAGLLVSSCTTINKTATTAPVVHNVQQYPMVTDVEVMDKVEVSTTWLGLSLNRMPLETRKGNLIAETLKEKGADVMLETQFVYTKKGFLRERKLTLIGFPAKYKGFHKATPADIEAMKASKCCKGGTHHYRIK